MTSTSQKKYFYILFVEDEINQIETHIDSLKNIYHVAIVRTANQAVEYINNPKTRVDFVIIDLFIPQDFNKLLGYEKSLGNGGINMNQGALVASWLEDKHPKIKYCYLSSEPGRVGEDLKAKNKHILFSKSFSEKEKLLNHINCIYEEGI